MYSCGIYAWTGASATETLQSAELTSDDVVFASITSAGGSAKSVSAAASESGITFTLDANGTASETKIAWMILRKN